MSTSAVSRPDPAGIPGEGALCPPAIGLIGVGGFGAYHLRYLREVEADGLGRLVAVADREIAGLAEVRRDLERRGVRWHADYLQMITETQLDLVIVATPIFLHVPMTLEILRRTRAAIYLEKPPAPTLPLLRELITADRDQRVHVGFQMTTWKVFRQLKEWACSGRLGKIHRITAGAVWPRGDAYYRRSGWAGRMITDAGAPVFDGPATNALAHLVHSVMHLASPTPDGFAQPSAVRGEFYRARPLESYDAACLSGRFSSGIEYAIAVAHCSRTSRDFGVRVSGDKGEAWISRNGAQLSATFENDIVEAGDPYDATMHRETLLRLRAGKPPVNSLTDCLGYGLATYGALEASVGIRDIPRRFIDLGSGDDDRIFHVAEMSAAVAETLSTGSTWLMQRRPWAVSTAVERDPATEGAAADRRPAGPLAANAPGALL